MLGKLLKKEFSLCLHPTAFVMLGLSALTLTPNYPYGVMYFYLTLSVFFICLFGRENHDVTFTMTLPVAKKRIVTARIAMVVILEILDLALAAVFILLRQALYDAPNAAGMDANLALLAEGFVFFGVFHLVFFLSYYKDVSKVGVSFIKSSLALAVLTVTDIVLCYSLPLFRDVLDTPDPLHIKEKLGFLALGLLFYLCATWLTLRIAQERFLRQDLR